MLSYICFFYGSPSNPLTAALSFSEGHSNDTKIVPFTKKQQTLLRTYAHTQKISIKIAAAPWINSCLSTKCVYIRTTRIFKQIGRKWAWISSPLEVRNIEIFLCFQEKI